MNWTTKQQNHNRLKNQRFTFYLITWKPYSLFHFLSSRCSLEFQFCILNTPSLLLKIKVTWLKSLNYANRFSFRNLSTWLKRFNFKQTDYITRCFNLENQAVSFDTQCIICQNNACTQLNMTTRINYETLLERSCKKSFLLLSFPYSLHFIIVRNVFLSIAVSILFHSNVDRCSLLRVWVEKLIL